MKPWKYYRQRQQKRKAMAERLEAAEILIAEPSSLMPDELEEGLDDEILIGGH